LIARALKPNEDEQDEIDYILDRPEFLWMSDEHKVMLW